MEIKRNCERIDKGSFPLCLGNGHVKHMLSNCQEIKEGGGCIFVSKWLDMNEGLSYGKIINSTNKTQIRNVGKYLDKARASGKI